MATWDPSIFGNDTACDWVYDLEKTSDLSHISTAIGKVLDSRETYLEASDAQKALVAIETITRLQGIDGPRNSYTKSLDDWVAANPHPVPPELKEKANSAIERILSENSELKDLWEEDDSSNAWKLEVSDLKSRLNRS